MFEKRIREISKKISKEDKKRFFVITYKKHRREIYFLDNKKSIKFIQEKFNSRIKKVIYFFIRIGILQPFLKKIYLTKKFGDVIYIGGQIKGFNLNKNIVLSFPLKEEYKGKFIQEKKFQMKKGKEGIAPKILKINKNVPFSEEEFLQTPTKIELKLTFKEILYYYEKMGVKKIKVRNYLKKGMKKELNSPIINLALDKLKPFYDEEIFITKIHGDFSKEQILQKKGSYFFTDWNPRSDLIISDLVNFFGNEEVLNHKKLLNNNSFWKILKLYPQEVKEKLGIYLILNEMSSILNEKSYLCLPRKRLKEFLSKPFLLENIKKKV